VHRLTLLNTFNNFFRRTRGFTPSTCLGFLGLRRFKLDHPAAALALLLLAILRLLKQLHLPEVDMFKLKDEIIDEAYRLQGCAVAYEEKTTSAPDGQP